MFTSYLKLGFEHILDPNGLDHVLFLLVLAIPYNFKDWKKVLILATAFTLGHSVTLALAALKLVSVNASLIEILIAVTIFLTAVFNMKQSQEYGGKIKYLIAAGFGLIHGLGFSNFFKSILGTDEVTIPLLAFNIGVECAQVIVVLLVLLGTWILCDILKLKQKTLIYIVSLIVMILSAQMIFERV